MRAFLIIGLLLLQVSVFAQQDDIVKLRALYKTAAANEQQAQELLEQSEAQNYLVSPLFLGYRGAAQAILSGHGFNPARKLKLFNAGVKQLEQAIQLDPKNIELRFLRFSIQCNCPSFLNYNRMLSEDLKFIIDNLQALPSKDKAFKADIVEFLLQSGRCSSAEEAQLKNIGN